MTSILFDEVLSPFYDRLSSRIPPSIHPNVLTCIGGVCVSLASVALRREAYGLASVSWFLYTALDNMDGKHARRHNMTSRLGAFLDHFLDGTLGSWVGYCAVYYALFAAYTYDDGTLFWRGFHAFTCLWLSPHVVAVFTGQLSLGTRYFSVDELFLIVTATLALAGWRGPGLIPFGVTSSVCLIELMRFAGVANLALFFYHDQYHRRGGRLIVALAYAVYCFVPALLATYAPLLVTVLVMEIP